MLAPLVTEKKKKKEGADSRLHVRKAERKGEGKKRHARERKLRAGL